MPSRHHLSRRYHPRSPHVHAGQLHARYNAPQHRERERIVARLAAASLALAEQPDIAALLLDGALIDMLNVYAQAASLPAHDAPDGRSLAQVLEAIDQHAPAISARLRLALQAHDPAARLAHCWALLDLLTTGSARTATTENTERTIRLHASA